MARGTADRHRRPALTWVLFGLLVLQALGGIGGGGALAIKPRGLLQMPMSYIEGSPFHDYCIPGVILPLVLGVIPLVVAIGLLQRRP